MGAGGFAELLQLNIQKHDIINPVLNARLNIWMKE